MQEPTLYPAEADSLDTVLAHNKIIVGEETHSDAALSPHDGEHVEQIRVLLNPSLLSRSVEPPVYIIPSDASLLGNPISPAELNLPQETSVLEQLQSKGYSLFEVVQKALSTLQGTDAASTALQWQMLQVHEQQSRKKDAFAAKFLASKAAKKSNMDSEKTIPLAFPLLSESQELFAISDIDLAKWILSDPATFNRARTLESFADAFQLNSVFTTKDANLYRELKEFFVQKTNNLSPEQYGGMFDTFQRHTDSMLRSFGSVSEIPFIPKIEGMVLEAYADSFFGMKSFPDAEECTILIKQIWQIKSLQNNIPSHRDDSSVSMRMDGLQNRLFQIIGNAQSLVDKAESPVAKEMSQVYISNGHAPGNLLNALIPLYEAVARGLVYALIELSNSQSLQKELHQEIARHSNDELQYCRSTTTLLHRVWQETLRLHPPTPNQTRRVTAKDNALFPHESKVVIVWSLFHQDPQVWGSDATQFNPNRWLNITADQEQNYNPFGTGVQRCVAMNYASFGGRVMLKRMLESAIIHPRNTDAKPDGVAADQGYSRGPDADTSVLRFSHRRVD